jgi:predicted nucleic acid-binding protein
VKLYLDAGVFLDYLIGEGHPAENLRASKRRGRDPKRLRIDVERCLTAIHGFHAGVTSTVTLWEVEEAMYGELARQSPESRFNARRVFVPAARQLVTQTLGMIDNFGIKLADLTRAVVVAQSSNLELQHRGIRAADALHVTTALAEDAELLITTDAELIRLDNVFENSAGASLRCVDTDQALALLA